MILYVAQKKCIKVMNVTILHSYGWWKKAATTTALTIGSKLLEQAFGTGDHKPKLVPGQIQPQPSKNVMQDTKIWKNRYTKKTYSNSDHKLHFAPEQAQPPTPGQQGCIRSLCGCASAIPNLSSTNSPKQGFYDKTLSPIKGHMCHVNSIHL